MTMGERIRYARKFRGYTQKQLAEKIGAKHNSISGWEKDDHKPDIDTIVNMCSVLNVNTTWLLGLDVPMQVDKEIIDDSPMMKALARNAQETGDTSMFNKFYMERYANKYLNDETYEFLTLFEKLNKEGQERLLQYANDLVDTNKYIKNNKSGMVEEAE